MWASRLAKVTADRQGIRPWLVALGIFAASILARLALGRWLEPHTFMTLFPAIMIATLLCGWRQGAAVLILTTLAAWYLLLPPSGSFGLDYANSIIWLIGFLLIGAFDIAIIAALAKLVRRLDEAKRVQESLFYEQQHRVANNMQIVTSILKNARRELQDSVAIEEISKAEAHIAGMAQLHRRLSDRSTYARGLEPVLRDVLAEAFRDPPVRVNVEAHAENLSIDQLTSIVLLVNEAAINAAKHVFRPGKGKLFEVKLSQRLNGRLRLVIRDDGPGIAAELGEEPGARSFGMNIMQAFAAQLGGSLEVLGKPGTTLSVEFADG
jgi:two-component sensor histidine kinase